MSYWVFFDTIWYCIRTKELQCKFTIHHTTAHLQLPAIEACTLLPMAERPLIPRRLWLCPQTSTSSQKRAWQKSKTFFPIPAFSCMPMCKKAIAHSRCILHNDRRLYLERLGEPSAFINAPAYSLHSGRRRIVRWWTPTIRSHSKILACSCSSKVCTQRDGPKEHLPARGAYIDVMNLGFCYAIDLSHLHIVANREGERPDWVYQLITHRTKEASPHNNGRSDAHRPIGERIWEDLWWKEAWLSALSTVRHDQPLHFTEGYIEHAHRHNISTKSQRKPNVQRNRTTQI